MGGNITVNLDLSGVEELVRELKEFQDEVQQKGSDLAAQTHAHIKEQVQQKLNTRREMYDQALSTVQEVGPGVWVISLDASAVWIEEGMCVTYGPAKRHQPSVLTPDGWVRLPEVRVGMLVLNQFGKWTRVVEIFDNPLLDFCCEIVDDDATRAQFGYVSTDLSPRSKKPIVLQCSKCRRKRVITKYDWSRTKQTYCETCGSELNLVTVKTKVAGVNRRFTLTGGHPVALKDGSWCAAQNLKATDKVLVPTWGNCSVCSGPTPFGEATACSARCGASRYQQQALLDGRHISQQPDWLVNVYKKMIAKGLRISGAEDAVCEVLRRAGYSVGFYGEGEASWIRQYRVPSTVDRLGRQKYYFLDFYSPELKLALEIDGAAFHTAERDGVRDATLRRVGIQVVHVPAKLVRSRKFEDSILPAILSNHQEKITFKDVALTTLKHRKWSRDLSLTRRWDIRVEDGASFVCGGILIHNSPHSMVDSLLRNNAKTAKDGSKYKVIPFDQGKGGATTTPGQSLLNQAVRQELQKRNINYKKIERHPDGRPKTGLLHKLDITSAPLRPEGTQGRPGFGKGAVGEVMQGPNAQGGSGGGTPLLQGLRIYQTGVFKRDAQGNQVPVMDKFGRQKVTRGIVTFRVVSSKHKGIKWEHPGLEGTHFFEEAEKWAEDQWTQNILPDILRRIGVT